MHWSAPLVHIREIAASNVWPDTSSACWVCGFPQSLQLKTRKRWTIHVAGTRTRYAYTILVGMGGWRSHGDVVVRSIIKNTDLVFFIFLCCNENSENVHKLPTKNKGICEQVSGFVICNVKHKLYLIRYQLIVIKIQGVTVWTEFSWLRIGLCWRYLVSKLSKP